MICYAFFPMSMCHSIITQFLIPDSRGQNPGQVSTKTLFIDLVVTEFVIRRCAPIFIFQYFDEKLNQFIVFTLNDFFV